MKIKILIVPLVVITSLYLIIWFIVPTYDSVKKKDIELAEVSDRLGKMDVQVSNAASLLESLNNNSEDQKVIVKYLPEKKQDENVLAAINGLAATSGIAVSGFEFLAESQSQDVELLYDDMGNEIPQKNGSAKTFQVNMAATGSYEKIRQFLFSLASITRFNEINSLSIEKDDEGNPDALSVKTELSFNYLEKPEEGVAVDNDVFFANGEFDLSVSQAIRKKATIDAPQIEIGGTGRGNLFAL